MLGVPCDPVHPESRPPMPRATMIVTSTLRESMSSIAEAICQVWEADVDTPAVYAEHCRAQNADLEHSVLATTPDGRLVGIGMLCRRGERGFVLDFGITPPYRGQGLGHQLFAALVERMRAAGLREVSLMVNAENVAAIRIYLQAGFQQMREMVTLRGKVAAYAPASASEVRQDLAATILAWYGSGKAARPYWERELPALLAMRTRAFENRRGFMLVRRSPFFRQVDIVHLGLDPAAVIEDVNGLVYAASAVFGDDLPLALVDEPEGSRACQQLLDLGFREVERNHEMRLTL